MGGSKTIAAAKIKLKNEQKIEKKVAFLEIFSRGSRFLLLTGKNSNGGHRQLVPAGLIVWGVQWEPRAVARQKSSIPFLQFQLQPQLQECSSARTAQVSATGNQECAVDQAGQGSGAGPVHSQGSPAGLCQRHAEIARRRARLLGGFEMGLAGLHLRVPVGVWDRVRAGCMWSGRENVQQRGH